MTGRAWHNSRVLYLDHAATTPMRPGVWEAMAPYGSGTFGNASGIHEVARRAKNALEEARERAAAVIGCRPREVVFTAGGTESDNLAVKGVGLSRRDRRVVVSAVEHEAVLESARFLASLGMAVAVLPVSADGVVDIERLSGMGEECGLISVMTANNETGVVQPLSAVADAVRRSSPDAVVHTDAVQAFSSHALDVEDLDVDLMSLAAHKFGGPKGVGLLYVRSGLQLEPVLHGGGQEMGRRSGTHNVMGAVGMVAAMELAAEDRSSFAARVATERNAFERAMTEAGAVITAAGVDRLPQHSHFRMPGQVSETMLMKLDSIGLSASAGSACQSGAITPSHVTKAMGWSDDAAAESVRITFGWTTEPSDGLTAAAAVIEAGRA